MRRLLLCLAVLLFSFPTDIFAQGGTYFASSFIDAEIIAADDGLILSYERPAAFIDSINNGNVLAEGFGSNMIANREIAVNELLGVSSLSRGEAFNGSGSSVGVGSGNIGFLNPSKESLGATLKLNFEIIADTDGTLPNTATASVLAAIGLDGILLSESRESLSLENNGFLRSFGTSFFDIQVPPNSALSVTLNSTSSGTTTAVPEPSSLTLIALSSICMIIRRRR